MITAPRTARQRTLVEQRGLDEKEAAKQIDKGDANRADYLKRFYGITHESPADYDLVPDDPRGYRVAFIEAFRAWGIYPRDVRTLSEQSLRWEPPAVPVGLPPYWKPARAMMVRGTL